MTEFSTLPITGWTALICGLLYIAQTLSVILKRRSDKIVYGDGDDHVMTKRIRGHANAAEQMPIFLILLALSEWHGGAPGYLTAAAAIFVTGRLAHAAYFARHGLNWRFRFWGMTATVIAQVAVLAALALTLLT